MSALGQKQTCAVQLATSAMGHKRTSRHLLSEQCRRHCQAAGLCGFEIDNQLVFSRSLHGKISGLLALEDAIDIASRPPKLVIKIGSIGDQAAGGDEETFEVTAGNLCRAASAMMRSRWIADDALAVTIRPPFGERAKAVIARSISSASRKLTGLTSTPADVATD
jgi:hypothetical protein